MLLRAPSITAGRGIPDCAMPSEELSTKLATLSKNLNDLKMAVDHLQSNYQALRNDILQAKTNKLLITSTAALTIPEASQPLSEIDFEALEEEARITTMEHKARLARAVEEEDRDDEWSVLAENEINALANSISSSQPENIRTDCRATMCKLSFYTTNRKTIDKLYQALQEKLSWQGAMDFSINKYAPNEFSAEVIIARQGFPLHY